jgi:hypothetical protein
VGSGEYGKWLTKHKSHCAIKSRKKGRPDRAPFGSFPDEISTTPVKEPSKNDASLSATTTTTSTSTSCSWSSVKKEIVQPKVERTFVTPSANQKKTKPKIHFDLTDESEEKMLLPGARYETIRNRHALFFHMIQEVVPRQTIDTVGTANVPRTTVVTSLLLQVQGGSVNGGLKMMVVSKTSVLLETPFFIISTGVMLILCFIR